MPPVLVPESDVERSELLPDGRTAVLVALPRPVFALRVQDWLDHPPEAETRDAGTPTGMLRAALDFLDFQQRGAWGCERQRTLVGTECEVTDTTMGRRQVAAVAAELRLEPALDGGIPVRPGGRALLPATVRARWRNGAGETVPWPDLPLRFEAPDGVLASHSARTDGEGHAEVAFVQSPPGDLRVRVTVDREALLGTLQELWPEVSVELGLRPVTLASGRLAVYLVESIANVAPQETDDPDGDGRGDGTQDEPGDPAGAATGAVVQTLEARGHRASRALGPDDARRLQHARGPDLVAALRAIAVEARGGIDHVAIGEARSDFASRMGARSVWHEAMGMITVYDAWSGEEVTTLERSARARGIGDRHAGRNALRALGNVIGDAIAELLRSRDATGAGAGASTDW
jgi:hypothetical protein